MKGPPLNTHIVTHTHTHTHRGTHISSVILLSTHLSLIWCCLHSSSRGPDTQSAWLLSALHRSRQRGLGALEAYLLQFKASCPFFPFLYLFFFSPSKINRSRKDKQFWLAFKMLSIFNESVTSNHQLHTN